ncbi:MAG: NADPH-dependent FMN reductase [Phycisphaerales bacterium]
MSDTNQPTIIAIAGSTRTGSWNGKVLAVAVEGAKAAGATVELIDLAEYPMPLYNGDLEKEKGLPEHAARLQKKFKAVGGILIAAPEYNSSITPLLKNTIDWLTRKGDGTGTLECFSGKVAGLISASQGALGGLRSLRHVREILGNIGVVVIPRQHAVTKVNELFDENGQTLKDEKTRTALHAVAKDVVEMTRKVNGQ